VIRNLGFTWRQKLKLWYSLLRHSVFFCVFVDFPQDPATSTFVRLHSHPKYGQKSTRLYDVTTRKPTIYFNETLRLHDLCLWWALRSLMNRFCNLWILSLITCDYVEHCPVHIPEIIMLFWLPIWGGRYEMLYSECTPATASEAHPVPQLLLQ
jgi:hypothetical protein